MALHSIVTTRPFSLQGSGQREWPRSYDWRYINKCSVGSFGGADDLLFRNWRSLFLLGKGRNDSIPFFQRNITDSVNIQYCNVCRYQEPSGFSGVLVISVKMNVRKEITKNIFDTRDVVSLLFRVTSVKMNVQNEITKNIFDTRDVVSLLFRVTSVKMNVQKEITKNIFDTRDVVFFLLLKDDDNM